VARVQGFPARARILAPPVEAMSRALLDLVFVQVVLLPEIPSILQVFVRRQQHCEAEISEHILD
jgi:hypothetical protein